MIASLLYRGYADPSIGLAVVFGLVVVVCLFMLLYLVVAICARKRYHTKPLKMAYWLKSLF